ncbi:MAG: Flp pilus assembly protein TadG [Thermoleophilia bacterium]|nr:Flp pilus assembly protein TadG [Thermoleophilia bacterium]
MKQQHPSSREHGQTLVLTILVMLVLLGFVAIVMEGGNSFLIRRDLQGTADVAAMAGAQRVTVDRSEAQATAAEYATSQNSDAGATVNTLVATGASTGTCNGRNVPRYSVCVRVQKQQSNLFGTLLGTGNQVRAQATATASMVRSMGGWLPFGVVEAQFTSGTQISFRPGSVSAAGSINAPAGDSCSFYGGNGVRDVIMSKKFGGVDACHIDVGDTIETQTGVTSGNLNHGFDARLGSNRDSFDDVFRFDAESGRYVILLPDSPRLGLVPLAEGTTWPLSGGAEMEVSGYAFAYIGNRSNAPTYPALSGSGSGLRIHLTPVQALLPDTWDTNFMDYEEGSSNIVAYRLVD